jgi:hypothetical protein
MNFRKAVFFLAAVAIVSCVSASAQVGVYGMFTADQLSNIVSSPLPPFSSALGPNPDGRSNSVNPLGGTGGAYWDFMKLGPVRLGVDARGSILTTKRGAYVNFDGPGARIYSVLGGVRASFHTPIAALKPYIQGSVGLGRSDYGLFNNGGSGPNGIYSNFEYEGLAGVDVRILPILDWRMVEFGYGGLDPFGTYSHNYPIKQVSSGFVVRFK